jgi:hypothetical protein
MQGQVSGQVGVMLLSQQRCIDLGLHFTAQQQQQQQQKGTSAAMDSVRPAAQQQQQQQQQQHQTQQGQVPAVAGTVDESTVEASRSAGSRSMSWQVLHTTPAPCCIISSHPCVAAAWRVLLMTAADAGEAAGIVHTTLTLPGLQVLSAQSYPQPLPGGHAGFDI